MDDDSFLLVCERVNAKQFIINPIIEEDLGDIIYSLSVLISEIGIFWWNTWV